MINVNGVIFAPSRQILVVRATKTGMNNVKLLLVAAVHANLVKNYMIFYFD